MTIESEIAGLTQATTDLLDAVNVRKATLDQKVAEATTQASAATTKAGEASAAASSASTNATSAANSAGAAANSASQAAAITGAGSGAFGAQPISTDSTLTLGAGTANGVLYLNGSKQATSGSALTFDGSVLGVEAELDVKSAANLLFLNSDNTNYMYLNNPAGSGAGIGQLAFTLGGVGEQMRLTSTGLGIGTSSPSARLHAQIGGSGQATPAALFFSNNDGFAPQSLFGLAIYNNRTGGFLDTNLVFGNSVNSYFAIGHHNGTSYAERMRIDASGNLGLGVTPSAWAAGYKSIDFGGNASVSGFANNLYLASNAYDAGGSYIYKDATSASLYLQTAGAHKWFTAPSGTAGQPISFTQAMTLDAGGNLGIGTTTPSQRIDAVTSGGSSYIRNHNGTIESFSGVSEAVGGAVYGTGNSYPVTFFTNGAERARIDSNGYFLVGRPSFVPGSAAYGTFKADGNATYGVTIANASTTDTRFVNFANSNDINIGSIAQSGPSVSYNTSSDYRLKNITGPIANSGTYIDSLNPVEGTWKADGSTFVGLIAHEVQEVSRTQVATGEKDGAEMQAMDYSNSELIANLIAEVKSLRARVAALESN